MKHGHNAAKDFIEFLRERQDNDAIRASRRSKSRDQLHDRATLEESYAKSLNKQSKFGGVGAPSTGYEARGRDTFFSILFL